MNRSVGVGVNGAREAGVFAVGLLVALLGSGCGVGQDPAIPGLVRQEWLQRFEDAEQGDLAAASEATGWTKEDWTRLRAGNEALACAEAVPEATTQEEADAIHQARTAAHVQPVLEEYWALSARETWPRTGWWVSPSASTPGVTPRSTAGCTTSGCRTCVGTTRG